METICQHKTKKVKRQKLIKRNRNSQYFFKYNHLWSAYFISLSFEIKTNHSSGASFLFLFRRAFVCRNLSLFSLTFDISSFLPTLLRSPIYQSVNASKSTILRNKKIDINIQQDFSSNLLNNEQITLNWEIAHTASTMCMCGVRMIVDMQL